MEDMAITHNGFWKNKRVLIIAAIAINIFELLSIIYIYIYIYIK